MKNKIQAEKLRYYIAYGSNLNIDQMAFRCPSAKVIGQSEIKDYELVFRGSKTGSYATIEPCDGKAVPILVWSTSKRDELALDIYEGYPNFYKKEEMVIEVNGIKITAYIYIMPDTHMLGVPSQRYIDTILQGYETANFDQDILFDAIENTRDRMEDLEYEQFEMRWW